MSDRQSPHATTVSSTLRRGGHGRARSDRGQPVAGYRVWTTLDLVHVTATHPDPADAATMLSGYAQTLLSSGYSLMEVPEADTLAVTRREHDGSPGQIETEEP